MADVLAFGRPADDYDGGPRLSPKEQALNALKLAAGRAVLNDASLAEVILAARQGHDAAVREYGLEVR